MTVRDGYGQTETTAQIGNPPGAPLKPGSMGRPLPGYTVALLDPVTSEVGDEGEICLDLVAAPGRADGRLPRRPDADRRGDARRLLPHRRRREPRRRRLHHLRRAQRRRVQGERLPHLAVRAGERADRAPGGRRGRRRAGARPGAARGAQGLRRAGRRARGRRRHGAAPSCRYAREHLAPYKRIRRLEFAELPKTISGKIRRVELRNAETERGHETRPRASSARRTSPTSRAEVAGWAACTSRCSTTSSTTTSTAARSSATSTSGWPGPPTSAATWRSPGRTPTPPDRALLVWSTEDRLGGRGVRRGGPLRPQRPGPVLDASGSGTSSSAADAPNKIVCDLCPRHAG